MTVPRISDAERQVLTVLAQSLGLCRDYGKECWIAVYAASIGAGDDEDIARFKADRAVVFFLRQEFSCVI